MRILLTGASGNFGREFIRQADFDVATLNRGEWGRLESLASGMNAVVHAASDLHSSVSVTPEKWLNSNLVSTARLLEAMKSQGIPRMIFLSSCAVYGEDMRTAEEEKCFPISINGIGKLLNEKIIFDFCQANGIKCEILRIFNMYGGVDRFSILSHMQRALESGAAFTLNNMGVAQRDFIHVSDVAKIVIRLLERQIPHTYLNIGTGVATKISKLVEVVMERFPSLEIRHAQLNEAEYSRADISKLRQFVDFEFIRVEDYLRRDFMRSADRP